MKTLSASLAVLLFGTLLAAVPDPVAPDPESPRPIAARDSVWIEDLTWMETRDAMRGGKDTVIIATGGIEQNGPYLALGKHNIILRGTAERIARRLGDALVAPIIPFVPEGDIDPPSVHMKYPGSISLTEDTYRRLLTDICASFRAHGFRHIVLIGDSGGNQDGMKDVAAALNAQWSDGGSRVHYVPEYYDYGTLAAWLEEQGVKQVSEGLHDDFAITALMIPQRCGWTNGSRPASSASTASIWPPPKRRSPGATRSPITARRKPSPPSAPRGQPPVSPGSTITKRHCVLRPDMPTNAEYERKIAELDWPGLRGLWQVMKTGVTPGWDSGRAFEYLILRAFQLDGAESPACRITRFWRGKCHDCLCPDRATFGRCPTEGDLAIAPALRSRICQR
jgi:creatinine amidohydrolase